MSLKDSTELPLMSKVPSGKVTCPICQQLNLTECIEARASFCGERYFSNVPCSYKREFSNIGKLFFCCVLYPNMTKPCHVCSYRASMAISLVSADEDTDGTEICPKRRRHQNIESIADIIQSIADKVDAATTFNICVTRDQMLERGMKLWQRQNKSSPKNLLTVSFIGEAGIDSGALRKEFLTEMLAGIERRFFEGGIDGKVPKYSMTDFEKYNFK
ncbi:uncharacterized protein LOC133630808 isoform X1 [Entelurus aequoreus]|uniref:uncharacterized protein LOC133630808 isoform X1 n=1 Tax=Entelurus aequoreus TaxID=161455 RepID=UPI002B1D475D|nr:uncharacterized protein LOC133630808 isoform X1 [Entelurus aequoreus]